MIIPKAYFDENKAEIVLFVQAGEEGYWVWSGISKAISSLKVKEGQDVVLTLSDEDFLINKQKSRNLIGNVGLGFHRNGSTVTEPILLRSITVRLPEDI